MSFQQSLVQHLSSQLNVPLCQVEEALDSFGKEVEKQTVKSEKKIETPPASKSSSGNHLCSRIKRGHTLPCGNNARKHDEELDLWFCTPCFKTHMKNKTTEVKKSKTKAKNEPPKKNQVPDLLNKLTKNKQVIYTPLRIGGESYLYNRENNIIADKETKKVLGVYDEETKSIADMTPQAIRWCETHNCEIARKKKVIVEEDNSENELEDDGLNDDDLDVDDSDDNLDDDDSDDNLDDDDSDDGLLEDSD